MPRKPTSLAVDGERDEHQLDVDRRAVLPSAPGDSMRTPARHGLRGGLAALVAMLLVEHEVVDLAPDRLLRRVAEQLCRGRVPAGHDLLCIHLDHRDRADADERLEVLLLATDLGEEARVLDRHAHVGGERREQARVVLAVSPFLARALDADHADRPVADPDRDAEVGLRRGADDRPVAAGAGVVLEERLARLDDLRGQALAERHRRLADVLAQLPVVRKLDHAGGLVVQGDVGDVRVERFADALADELDQLVEVELGRERLADAVHRRRARRRAASSRGSAARSRARRRGCRRSSRAAAGPTG